MRKSGVTHGESGLSATEQKTRAAIRKAKFDMRVAKALAEQWENRTLTWKSCYRWQKTLFHNYHSYLPLTYAVSLTQILELIFHKSFHSLSLSLSLTLLFFSFIKF